MFTFYDNMKILPIALIICFSSIAVRAQELLTWNDSQPIAFYEDIQLSLSNDHVKDALHTFSRVIAHYKRTGEIDKLPESYFGMALALAMSGNYKESIRYHKLAIRSHRKIHHNDATEMSINLGLTYLLAGRERKAHRILGDFQFGS
jgi:hypothetical protein